MSQAEALNEVQEAKMNVQMAIKWLEKSGINYRFEVMDNLQKAEIKIDRTIAYLEGRRV